MQNVLNILSSSGIFDANETGWQQESPSELAFSVVFSFILFVGISLLIYWLSTTSFGKTSLENTRPRRNAMAFYMPLIPFGVWILLGAMGASFINHHKNLTNFQEQILTLVFTFIIAIVMLGIIFYIVRNYFVRGFKGFGLDARRIGRDLVGAITKLLAVWPLVLLVLVAIVVVGKSLYGPDFEIAKHEELDALLKYKQWPMRIAIIFLAVVLAPITEEMLFRGLFQTMLRSASHKPWFGIAIASAIFSMAHANAEHWPALFVLALGLGYAYEKSGSLLQPIFMHAIFNGAMITAALMQGT
jgi:membrane protease YdiL (CAAX protease family)